MRRTAQVKLAIPDERRDDLKQTMRAFNDAAQMFANRGWEGNDEGYIITARSRLQSLVYADVREELGLHSDLCIGAVNLAAANLRGAVEQMKAGNRAGKPTYTAPTATYNTNAVSYFLQGEGPGYCTLAALNGRVRADFVYPPDEDCPQRQYLDSEEWDAKGATLHYDRDDGDYFLHVTLERDEPETELGEAENGTVLGVDLGVENIAVTSTGLFYSGGLFNHRRDEYERVRASFQRTGTESAHRTIVGMGDREHNWNNDVLHRISKAIVEEALTHDCSAIAFEDLTDIRNRMPGARKFHGWAFRQLFEYVTYKAEYFGIRTVQVDPAYTSQRCSKCGLTHRSNRTSQAEFCCQKCDYEVHADYNAAKNIATKHLRSGQKSPAGGATNQLALKSGTLNGNGQFRPASVEA